LARISAEEKEEEEKEKRRDKKKKKKKEEEKKKMWLPNRVYDFFAFPSIPFNPELINIFFAPKTTI